MTGEEKTPMLLCFYFGEAAGRTQQGISRRLRRWSRAFEEWMAERKHIYQADTVKQSTLAWRRLARQCGKMPWEMRREDIENHAKWMEAEGYARSTIHCSLGIIANFFGWCDDRRIDAACEPGFNPAAKAEKPRLRRYEEVKLWSREEVEALLRTLRRDTSELGRRELAFFTARVQMGVRLKSLQHLQWGQIDQDEPGTWVRWRETAERVRLPEEAWEAILAYLTASGRLKGMTKEKYVFVPLAESHKEVTGSKAEDWVEGRSLSTSQLLANLKLYGRLAGIAEEKLTLMALRHTAVRLKLDAGGKLEELQDFMDSQEGRRYTKYRLKKLPAMPEGDGEAKAEDLAGEIPGRRARPFKPGERVKHGLYTRHHPKDEVRAIMAEDIQGMDEEIKNLRILIRGLLEQEGNIVEVGEAYSQAVRRLGEVAVVRKQSTHRKEKEWVKNIEDFLEQVMAEGDDRQIQLPVQEEAGEDAALGRKPEGMAEEIATIRLILRKTFRLAVENQEAREYMRLTGLYSSGCTRLARLLKLDENNYSQLANYYQVMIERAINEVAEEFGIQ